MLHWLNFWIIPSCHLTGNKDLFKVLSLASICDNNNSKSLLINQPVSSCSHISGVIVISTIRFYKHKRRNLFIFFILLLFLLFLLLLRFLFNKDALSPFTHSYKSLIIELFNNSRNHRIIETFSFFFKCNLKSLIYLFKLSSWEVTENLPSLDIIRI